VARRTPTRGGGSSSVYEGRALKAAGREHVALVVRSRRPFTAGLDRCETGNARSARDVVDAGVGGPRRSRITSRALPCVIAMADLTDPQGSGFGGRRWRHNFSENGPDSGPLEVYAGARGPPETGRRGRSGSGSRALRTRGRQSASWPTSWSKPLRPVLLVCSVIGAGLDFHGVGPGGCPLSDQLLQSLPFPAPPPGRAGRQRSGPAAAACRTGRRFLARPPTAPALLQFPCSSRCLQALAQAIELLQGSSGPVAAVIRRGPWRRSRRTGHQQGAAGTKTGDGEGARSCRCAASPHLGAAVVAGSCTRSRKCSQLLNTRLCSAGSPKPAHARLEGHARREDAGRSVRTPRVASFAAAGTLERDCAGSGLPSS